MLVQGIPGSGHAADPIGDLPVGSLGMAVVPQQPVTYVPPATTVVVDPDAVVLFDPLPASLPESAMPVVVWPAVDGPIDWLITAVSPFPVRRSIRDAVVRATFWVVCGSIRDAVLGIIRGPRPVGRPVCRPVRVSISRAVKGSIGNLIGSLLVDGVGLVTSRPQLGRCHGRPGEGKRQGCRHQDHASGSVASHRYSS